MPGKLKGQMMAATPTGWRIMYSSTPRATSSEKSPIINMGMPHATSTFSMARRISPRASSSTLPFSMVIERARSSKCSSISALSLKRYWMRAGAGVRRQAGKAASASRAASSTVSAGESGTVAITSFVAGLGTFKTEAPCGSRHSPFT